MKKISLFVKISAGCMLAAALHTVAGAQQLKLQSLSCEYAVNPVGIDAAAPRLSWKIASAERGVMQTAYEIRVSAEAKKNRSFIWQTGKVASAQSVYIPYSGPALQSGKRYYWQARVWDNHGHTSPWSAVQFWEMGLLQSADWKGNWIEAGERTNGKTGPAPLFRKAFSLSKGISRARLYITAHGLYEAELNGQRIGDHYFTPGWTSYKKRLQYQIYDVTGLLKKGDNVLGASVGDGWYRGNLEFNNKRNLYGKEAGLLLQLAVEYRDGSTATIGTDGSWKYTFNGPVRGSDIYNGEVYDARLYNKNWSTAGYKDADWKEVRVTANDSAVLTAPVSPPVMKREVLKPVRLIRTPKGATVIDFGQNLVGWAVLKLSGKGGDTITVQHAEVLDKEGNFYTGNLRKAKQENKYVLSGSGPESFEPHFTFQGFRYIKIEGYEGQLDSNNVQAVALYSAMPETGSFVTSDSLINQLQHNIQWGQRGNFLDVPTDCPQRDERLGWTADAQVFFNTAAYNRDVSGFFVKWLKDLALDQLPDGNVPVVIPNVREPRFSGSAGWADAATVIPWNFYEAYADKQLLEAQYSSMKAWVDYMKAKSRNGLATHSSSYGDWLFYSPADDKYGKAALTDRDYVAQAYYAYSTGLLLKAATVLNKKEDIAVYSKLLEQIKEAFRKEYLTPNGKLVSNSQTAYVLALYFDLLPQHLRQQAADRLVQNIKEYNNHLTTGFLGTPYLCHVLSRYGYADVAYTLLFQETYPSWLYPVKMGATTIWERWDGIKPDGSFQNESMNSFNHYAYGAIGDWMYKTAAGIQPDSAEAGYKKIVIAPKPGGRFTFVSGELETIYGRIRSAWRKEGARMIMEVNIPANTTATLVLPGGAEAMLPDGLQKKVSGKDAVVTAGSGNYHFEY